MDHPCRVLKKQKDQENKYILCYLLRFERKVSQKMAKAKDIFFVHSIVVYNDADRSMVL